MTETARDRAKVKVSLGIPNCREGRLHPVGTVTPDWMRLVAQLAEDLNYYSLWLNEFPDTEPSVRASFAEGPRYYDPLAVIADLAARTERIRFLTATLVLPEHAPLLLGRQASTLNSLTNGRVSIGVGLGGSKEEYRRLHGELDTPNRGAMMDDFLGALNAYRTNPLEGYSGKYVEFDAIHTGKLPSDDQLPIFVAGASASVFPRIARYADGWIDSHHSPDEIHDALNSLTEIFASTGRKESPIVLRQFNVSLAPTQDRADALVDEILGEGAAARPPSGVDRRLIGTPEAISTRLTEYVDAGVSEICAIFFGKDVNAVTDQIRMFTDQVLPKLR